MNNIYTTLEFPKIQESIKQYAKSELGKKYIDDLKSINDYVLLKQELEFVKEMMEVNARYGSLPISFSSDLSILLSFANKGGILTAKDLNFFADDVITASRVVTFIKKAVGSFDSLQDYVKDFNDLTFLENAIHGVIAPNLTIYDNASSELRSVRRQIASCETELQSKINGLVHQYSSILSDGNITIRNDHFVLPVKSAEKNKINGIIHDVSDTGLTTFIEPNVIVELNNKIYLFKVQEQEEIRRILRELTKMVINHEAEVLANNQMIGYLDFVQAKAIYGMGFDGYTAEIEKDPQIHLHLARHPLINKATVVANTFDLVQNQELMIITGPNAGGKTVALKSIGLLILMNQCGLAIPTSEHAHLSIFNNIYLDIGDNQSILENLSTFSAHMGNIAQIMNKAAAKDLILIDELGTGTSPKEGEALAVSIIKEIIARHSFAVISSHFEGVKMLAMQDEHILNASMLFNEEKLAPTYRLKVGMPGKSYGIDVASRLGMNDKIIDNAKTYLGTSTDVSFDQAINKLEKQILVNDDLANKLKEKEQQLVLKEQKADKVLEDIDKIKQRAMDEAEEQKEAMIAEANKKIDVLLKELKEQEALKPHMITAAKKSLEEMNINEVEIEYQDSELHIDDYVKIRDTNMIGRITRINRNNLTVITTEGMTINTKNNQCMKTLPPKKAMIRQTKGDAFIMGKSVSLEHNVIGMHVDEALDSVAKYLDDARVKKFKTVRIIHGAGTGALRKAIHEYLDKQLFVDSYRLGGAGEGGVGATVVTFK